jgi:hypothetical protein
MKMDEKKKKKKKKSKNTGLRGFFPVYSFGYHIGTGGAEDNGGSDGSSGSGGTGEARAESILRKAGLCEGAAVYVDLESDGRKARVEGVITRDDSGSLKVRVTGGSKISGGGAPVGNYYPLDAANWQKLFTP